jgi:DNA-binding transcriptional ArsR family regulator
MDSLLKTLKDVCIHIKKIHAQYNNIILSVVDDVDTNENFTADNPLISRYSEKNDLAVCLISPYVFIEKPNKETDGSLFILGYKYEVSLANKPELSNYKNAFTGLDLNRLDILNKIHENKQLTMSEVSKLANMSKSTASRHMNSLHEDALISPVRREGANVYFEVNVDNMEKLLSNVGAMFGIDLKGKK